MFVCQCVCSLILRFLPHNRRDFWPLTSQVYILWWMNFDLQILQLCNHRNMLVLYLACMRHERVGSGPKVEIYFYFTCSFLSAPDEHTVRFPLKVVTGWVIVLKCTYNLHTICPVGHEDWPVGQLSLSPLVLYLTCTWRHTALWCWIVPIAHWH